MRPPGGSWAALTLATLLVAACSGGSPPVSRPSGAQSLSPSPPASAWRPTPGTTWQWQLQGTVDLSVEAQVYDIDVDNSGQVVAALHAKGRRVVCYFEAGTQENWRPDA